jgi:hypothetical protein
MLRLHVQGAPVLWWQVHAFLNPIVGLQGRSSLQILYVAMLRLVKRFKGDRVIWTAWKNGKHGRTTGYGFRVSLTDRDRHFNRAWQIVIIDLPHNDQFIAVRVNIDAGAFWRSCCELRSIEIRQWLYRQHYAPWPERKPPKFRIECLKGGHFRLLNKL